MISQDEKKFLFDVKSAIENIDLHLDSRRIFNEYTNNITKKRAVERELEIIGEAISKLLKISPKIPISSARMIVNLRNRVIHAYDAVDDVLVWKIIQKDIPILYTEVNLLLNEN